MAFTQIPCSALGAGWSRWGSAPLQDWMPLGQAPRRIEFTAPDPYSGLGPMALNRTDSIRPCGDGQTGCFRVSSFLFFLYVQSPFLFATQTGLQILLGFLLKDQGQLTELQRR